MKISTTEEVQKRREDFDKAAKPLIEYLNDNHHPHTKIIVDPIHAEIMEGVMSMRTEEFLKD